MQKKINIGLMIISLLVMLQLIGCSTTTPKFDRIAYEKAVSLKVDSLALMNHGTEPYIKYIKSIENLKLELSKAYEYAKGKPKNQIITKQWKIIRSPEHNQIGGYLKRWKEKGRLSKIFIVEAQKLITKGFDQVIGLESGLIKEKNEE
jgi:hypothetical protein